MIDKYNELYQEVKSELIGKVSLRCEILFEEMEKLQNFFLIASEFEKCKNDSEILLKISEMKQSIDHNLINAVMHVEYEPSKL